MSTQVIIPAGTGAVVSQPFDFDGRKQSFISIGTYAATEYAKLQVWNGVTWIDVKQHGTTEQIDNLSSMFSVYGKGRFRISKSATAASAGVAVAV